MFKTKQNQKLSTATYQLGLQNYRMRHFRVVQGEGDGMADGAKCEGRARFSGHKRVGVAGVEVGEGS